MNPWLEISLEEYESHMAMESIGQAQFLARVFQERVHEFSPSSVAVIGCSGGNGFQNLPPEHLQRVVGVDINPQFIQRTRQRYVSRFKSLELYCGDILDVADKIPPAGFVFAGLLLEYVGIEEGVAALATLTAPAGVLDIVLQCPSEEIDPVSPSPYKNLLKLESSFTFVRPDDLLKRALSCSLKAQREDRHRLVSGKEFVELIFTKED